MDVSHQSELSQEKRGRQPPVPFGFEALLNDEQKILIEKCRNFGWELAFIRRPLFQSPTVVMTDDDHGNAWQVTEAGSLEAFNNLRTMH